MVTIKSRKLQFRFAQWCGESFYFTSMVRGIMETTKTISKLQSLLLTLILMVAALGVGSAAMAAEMVKDPSTGEMVEAPQYGGTLTFATGGQQWNWDPFYNWTDPQLTGILEKLAIGNWGVSRDEWDLKSGHPFPMSVITGRLAESWEMPDNKTYIFHIRQGVRWHNKPPMNGRLLTAQDVEFTFHRMLGMGDFTEAGPTPFGGAALLNGIPFESITATDDATVVMKLKKPFLSAFHIITLDLFTYIMPPEVIKQYGDSKDWRNLSGTGPFLLTDVVEGSSETRTRNPDYWGHDEKYPQNRLPYIDELKYLMIPEEATRMSALRSGKIDLRGPSGGAITSIDTADSLRETNPDIVLYKQWFRSGNAFAANVRKPPFDDLRVRKALQMALDLETVAATYFKGEADPTPQGMIGVKGYYIPFEEWPEEVKKGYRYDLEGAKQLLAEAGYPNGFKTRMRVLGGLKGGYSEIAAAYWAEIGVELEIDEITDWAKYHEDLFARDYEGIMGSIAGTTYNPSMTVTWYRSDAQWNRPLHQWPELDAKVDAALAATTFEEQQRLIAEADMYTIENHWQIWGPKGPQWWALHPWIKGYNGEFDLGPNEDSLILSRLWIDQDLKKEMGH